MTEKKVEGSHFDEVFHQVMALYTALQEAGQFPVKRAEMKQGECAATAVDFCADVELKARREISENLYAWLSWANVLRDPETYPRLHIGIREQLGMTFEAHRLGADGDYRSLYARR